MCIRDRRKEGQEELFIAEYTEGDKSPRQLVKASPVRAPSAAPSQSSSSIASSEGSAKPNAGQWVQDRNTSWIERHQHLKEQRDRLAAQQCTTQGRLKEVQSHLNKLRKDQSRKDHKKLPEAEFNKTVQVAPSRRNRGQRKQGFVLAVQKTTYELPASCLHLQRCCRLSDTISQPRGLPLVTHSSANST